MRFWRRTTIGVVIVIAAALTSGCKSTTTAAPQPTSSGAPVATAAAPATTAPVVVTGKKGCDLVSRAEASSAAGMTMPAGKTDPYTLTALIVAHSGCGFNDGTHAIGFDLNTVAASHPIAAYAELGWTPILTKVGGTKITVGGNPGISVAYATAGITEVEFYKGQVLVIVSTSHVKAGAGLTIANLIAGRM